ncbi:MAG: hypothetical protein GX814_03860 [Microbacteriaceae bacterium]|nr:hypothetical protein [Microbacteriaceae bacterium]
MSSTLALASAVASLDRESLARLVAARKVLSVQSVADPLGLAIELLRADSITKALTVLHRDTLFALLECGDGAELSDEHAARLLALGLIGLDTSHERPVPLAEVTEALRQTGFPQQLAHAHSDLTASDTAGVATDASATDTSSWYGPALSSVRRVAELLRVIAHRPVRLNRRGVPTSLAVRDLAERIRCEPDEADRLIQVMRVAGLLEQTHHTSASSDLMVSSLAAAWLGEGYVTRWIDLARPVMAGCDDRLRRGLAATDADLDRTVQQLPGEYPLLPQIDLDAALTMAQIAHDLGLTVRGRLTPAAVALLESDTATARTLAAEALPAPVAGVYLQPDLSLIVPGPLAHADEAALSVLTEIEQLGAAASLRVSTSSLRRAVRAGYTPQGIREFLSKISLTGVPQPLDFALDDLERTLAEHAEAARTTRPSQSLPLNPLEPGFAASSGAVLPVPASPFTAALSSTDPLLADTPSTTASARDSARSEELEALITRVYEAAQQAGGDGAMIRRIELAIRERVPLTVTAAAGSEVRSFTLLPLSLRSGRLRASDEVAGVERTIPLAAITTAERVTHPG